MISTLIQMLLTEGTPPSASPSLPIDNVNKNVTLIWVHFPIGINRWVMLMKSVGWDLVSKILYNFAQSLHGLKENDTKARRFGSV